MKVNIVEQLKGYNINPLDVARILDIDECSARELVAGRIKFRQSELLEICEALGIGIEDLIG